VGQSELQTGLSPWGKVRPNRFRNRRNVELIGVDFPRNKSDQMNSKNLQSAIQSLVWAIEEIEKTCNKQAECHARLACV
jgi:hypothetical protein